LQKIGRLDFSLREHDGEVKVQSEMNKIIYLTDFKVKRIKSKITNIR
jgi:hypothetical protein